MTTTHLEYVSEYTGQPIRRDPGRTAVERETCFYFLDDSRQVEFQTCSVPLMRALLHSDGVSIKKDGIELTDGAVTSVMGSFPITMLGIHTPRQSLSLSQLVSSAIQIGKNGGRSGGRRSDCSGKKGPDSPLPAKKRGVKPLILGEGGAQ